MAKIDEFDIGQHVTYRSGSGETEIGIVTSKNSAYVFVQYATMSGPVATYPQDLTN